jgi:hypothetical protein
MIEIVIGIKGDLAAGSDRVGVWSNSATVVASEVGIMYIFDLGEKLFIQSVNMNRAKWINIQDHGSDNCLVCE